MTNVFALHAGSGMEHYGHDGGPWIVGEARVEPPSSPAKPSLHSHKETRHMNRIMELIEAGTSAASIDREHGVLRNVVMLMSASVNGAAGRTYPPATLKKIASMAEGLPAYANHVANKADAFKSRDIRELIGRHKNVRYDATQQRVL